MRALIAVTACVAALWCSPVSASSPVSPGELEVVDASGRVLGPVAQTVGASPVVMLRGGSAIVRVYVAPDGLHGEGSIVFRTADCTGTPYTTTQPLGPFVAGPLIDHALYAGWAWQAKPGSEGRTIQARSSGDAQGRCESDSASAVWVHPAVRVLRLPVFVPPFSVR